MVKNRGKLDSTLAAMFSNPAYAPTYLFYAHIISKCTIIMRDDIPAPAGVSYDVDHYNLYINKTLFDAYTLVERLAILKHEMLHILYDHVGRQNKRESKRWNIATDCALNQQINIEHLPDNCIIPETIKEHMGLDLPLNKSAETYYDMLEHDSDIDHDDHQTWEESNGDPDLKKTVTRKMMEDAQEQTLKSCGKIPNDFATWLSINTVKAEINWKKVLANVVGNKRVNKIPTIKRMDRRFPKRDDLRGKIKDRKFDLLVIVDISGSMSNESINNTLSEVKNICKWTKTNAHMIQVDSVAHPPEILSEKTKKFERRGNGGTILFKAIGVANKYNLVYDAVVILTDGYVSNFDLKNFEKINKRTVWLIEKDGVIPNVQGNNKAVKLC